VLAQASVPPVAGAKREERQALARASRRLVEWQIAAASTSDSCPCSWGWDASQEEAARPRLETVPGVLPRQWAGSLGLPVQE
jgi:hypothetical protein